jgi:prevent-host-death family protein
VDLGPGSEGAALAAALTALGLRGGANVTIILVMETLPLSHVKAHLSEIADRVEGEHDRIVVTRRGRPAAVIVSPDDLESLEETLAVLSDPELMRQIRESEAAVEEGDTVTLEELQENLKRGREAAA